MQAFLGNELATTLPQRYSSFGNQSFATKLTQVSMEKWKWIPSDQLSIEHVSATTKISQRFPQQ
jgi:hypothetical protein